MGTTRKDIQVWFERGVREGKTHLIVVCDTYDWEDYAVYVSSDQDVNQEYEKFNGKNMQKVMEVYKLSEDMNDQLSRNRCFNF